MFLQDCNIISPEIIDPAITGESRRKALKHVVYVLIEGHNTL